MSLTDLDSAGLIKAFVGYCYPKELVTFTVVHSGNVKKVTGYYEYIDRIELTSVTPSRKTSLAAVTSANDWYHDRDAGIIYYYTTSASLPVVVRFGFFFKTGDTEVFKTGITTGELVYYHGRMQETSFNQSIDDISTGTLGVYSTNISFINEDGFYNYLAKDSVSFIGSDIVIYLFVNTITNNAVVFKGTVEQAKYSGYDFSLSVKDINKLFSNQPKYTTNEADFIVTSSNYSGASSEAIGARIPYILGRKVNSGVKKIKTFAGETWFDGGEFGLNRVRATQESFELSQDREKKLIEAYAQGNRQVYRYDSNGNQVIPSSFYGNTNVRYRKYISCITDNPIQTYTTPIAVDVTKITGQIFGTMTGGGINGGADQKYFSSFVIEVPDASLYFEGQGLTVDHTHSSGAPFKNYYYYTQSPLYYIGKIDLESNKLYCYMAFYEMLYRPLYSAGVWGMYGLYFHPISIYFRRGNNCLVTQIAQYKDSVTLSDGRYRHDFSIMRYSEYFKGNLLAAFISWSEGNEFLIGNPLFVLDTTTSPTILNDTSTELESQEFGFAFAQQNTNLSLGNMIHKTARWVGFETDGGTGYNYTANPCSFRDLDTKLGATTFDLASTDEDSYLGLLQKMLSSVFGFLYLKNDGKIGVRLFENRPYACNIWEISEDDIASGSIDSEFDCTDIKTRIKYIGPNGEDFAKYKIDSAKIQLHGDIIKEDENFLEKQSIYETKVLNRKYAYLSNPIKRFYFTIINNGYEIILGDIIKVSFTISQKWLGVDKEFELFVIGVNKSLRGVDITAIENTFPTL